jgi:uncharacterized protein YodC (DUF2158 family)
MSEEFKAGDVVQLKSGGPVMTVKQLHKATPYVGQYQCQWFGGKKLESGFFFPYSLKQADVDAK